MTLLEALKDRVLLCDGAMGSRVQALSLDIEKDYWGKENCTEVLNLSRPDLVRDIHKGYFAAGADIVQTNSFGGSPITLGEFDLTDKAHEINKVAAELAREAAESFADGRKRYVLGSIGPGTKLPSLGHIAYGPLEDALAIQAAGLVAGGVDAILIETCQDPLQIKAAVNGAKRATSNIPIFVQVTVETTKTLLVGTDIAAAATIIEALDIPLIGLNCATGPLEMAEQVKWLAENWAGLIAVQPNAGLPELHHGHTHYPLTPHELAAWHKRFILEDGINMVGGCCGTTAEHIAAVNTMLMELDPQRPKVRERKVYAMPAVASLYTQVGLRQENSYFSIGERCNANGSKRWRELQEAHDWDGCVGMAQEQVNEGSNALDICTAFVGRDEVGEMCAVLPRIASAVTVPLVIDSTELKVLEAALPLYGGKAIINSINFEDGEEPARARLRLAKKFGAAVIALTIDEEGMAKTPERKLAIAQRLYNMAVHEFHLKPHDLLIDPLTFTVATGNEDDRKLGLYTLEGIELIAKAMPDVQIILGLSNISFGLTPAARHVVNSVMLDLAMKRGMTGAIVHVSKIAPLHKIAPEEVQVAEDLIFDRRREGYDPLEKLLELFADRKDIATAKKQRADSIEQVLKDRIVDGDKVGLEADLAEAMKTHPPLNIINNLLLDGMKVVGELFGAGKMQLPFVLRSAECMKAAVAWLEPHMEKVEGQNKGTMVLATVKGDVHDIGKNLVDIILTNNGYKVVNLGIKQPLTDILAATKQHNADAIGMSGLLVKSTVIMKENLEEMARQGLSVPVVLGGAALTRGYVEGECAAAYSTGHVAYARDAFDGLGLMDTIMKGEFPAYCNARTTQHNSRSKNERRKLGEAVNSVALSPEEAKARRLALQVEVPTPPFWGARLIERVEPKALLPYLNERILYQLQWGYRKEGKSLDEYLIWAQRELKPILLNLLERCERENILQPQVVYGYYKAIGQGEDLVLYDGEVEAARFTLPRAPDGQSIADYVRDESNGPDVVALQVVTMGQRCADVAREWFAQNDYQNYLYLHGLSVELTEALAEYTHKRIRAELGLASEDARDLEGLLQQKYRGSRYSFGYPACPNLEDQIPMLKLLGAERIGVAISDEFQLHPEQSTSALVIHHPKAKYFSV